MQKNFQYVEDVLADEAFLAWYDSRNEKDAVQEEWLAENPQQQSLVDEAIVFMNNLPQQEILISRESIDEKLGQLQSKMNQVEAPVVRMRTSRRRWWIGAAAAVLIIASGLFFWKFNNPSRPVLDTSYGQISTNQLPDGSTMILNANSTARLSQGWKEGKDREVWLNGEAFFKVTKTQQKSRFIVHTGKLDVIVTGTQFNVMHRDNKTTVLLTEGSVTIKTNDGREINMKPGDYVVMDDHAVENKPVKEEDVLAWKDNRISFDNTSITEVAQIITNHYGVKVTLGDSGVVSKSVTGIMPNNNLDILLKAIEMGVSIKIERSENEIIFSSK